MIKTYPIYSIAISYIQDDIYNKNNESHDKDREGLPVGRIRNMSCYHNRMFRKRPDVSFLKQKYINNFLEEKKNINPTDIDIKIKLIDYETWCLAWFSHYTLDNGQSDVEILESFEKYVRRIQRRNQDEGYMNDQGYWQEPYCLMGAEDRWRWRAASENGDNNQDPDKYPPPCRCNGCKERSVIAINH